MKKISEEGLKTLLFLMKYSIYIIPGILARSKKNFKHLLSQSDDDFDIFISSLDTMDMDKRSLTTLQALVLAEIEDLTKRYDGIFLISHSSGSELILRGNFGKSVKGGVFWSPSRFYSQAVTETLLRGKDGNTVIMSDGVSISLGFSQELDALVTESVLPFDKIPLKVYVGVDDDGSCWDDAVRIPFNHNYSTAEQTELLGEAKKFFRSLL